MPLPALAPLSASPLAPLSVSMRSWILALVLALGVVSSGLTVSCTKRGTSALQEKADRPQTLSALGGLESSAEGETERSKATPVAEVPLGTLGPRLATVGQNAVIVWASPRAEGSVLMSSFVPDGRAASAPRAVAHLKTEPRHLVLRGHESEGVACVLVRGAGTSDLVELVFLGTEGETITEPVLVAEAPGAVLWAEVVSSAHGFVVFWATRAARAVDVYSASVDRGNVSRPVSLARGVLSWQVGSGRAGLALVTSEGGDPTSIILRQLGDQGRPIGEKVVLAADVRGGFDLDLAMTKERVVVAYSEKDRLDSRISMVETDAGGNLVAAPKFFGEPSGTQSLVRLVASESSESVDVVWQDASRSALKNRRYLVAPYGPDRRPQPPSFVLTREGADPLLPMVGRDKSSLYALTEGRSCSSCEPGLALVEMSGDGVASEQLVDQGGKRLSMAWDLTCQASSCAFLGASGQGPSAVSLFRVKPLKKGESALVQRADSARPEVTSDRAIQVVPELSNLVGAEVRPGHLALSWLSYFDPETPYVVPTTKAPDGRFAPVRAQLKTFELGREDLSVSQDWFVSYRARSPGGLDWVPPESGRSLLVWTALDNQKPQLFATLLKDGHKLSQKMLTRAEEEILDVASVRADTGYLLAWVGERGENSFVYALRVDSNLTPAGPPAVLSSLDRSPTSVALAVSGKRALLVWTDQGVRPDRAELFVRELDLKTGKPVGAEMRVGQSSAHHHSPVLLPIADSEEFRLAWLESQIPLDASGVASRGRLMLGRVAADGRLMAPPRATPMPGEPQSLDLSCTGDDCRAVSVIENDRGRLDLWAARLSSDSSDQGRTLLSLGTDIAGAVVAKIIGNEIYYSDYDDLEERWLLRRATIAW